jgi:hypothetical protein
MGWPWPGRGHVDRGQHGPNIGESPPLRGRLTRIDGSPHETGSIPIGGCAPYDTHRVTASGLSTLPGAYP